KTGTLTQGTPELTNLGDFAQPDLQVALALADASSHPLAVSLTAAAKTAGVKPATLTDLHEVPGYGIEGTWKDQPVRLGRAAWVGAVAGDQTATFLQIGTNTPQAFTFTDRLREGAANAVAALKAQGMSLSLISGDAPAAVEALANRLGFDDWIAEALPEDKAARIAALTDAGARVLMVGDGLNDTAALAAAHVSISPATALDAARVASDIVLLGNDMSPMADATVIARKATKRIKKNFGIAALYNMIAVPIALLGFATPLIAALAMSASSITVSLNALRLR
ncbi:MAG: HAD-IC family P-type ATPase, partial [Marinosulfonomonas sp.]|nr:HAD-IC family P-type ATPase [Marinosulfonomonas sp.]